MSNSKKWIVVVACMLMVHGVWGQRQTFLVNGLHPGISITNMKPTSTLLSDAQAQGQPNTGSMVWMPDGRLFIATMWDPAAQWSGYGSHIMGPSPGFMFSGIPGAANNSAVTVANVVSGFYMPLGATLVGDTLFVVDDSNGIMKLVPKGDGTYTRQVLYHGILGQNSDPAKSDGALNPNNKRCGDRRWGAGLLYKNGYFYSSIGMGM